MEQQQTETSLLKKAWQTHGKFTKYASGMGLIVTCCILPMSAVKAVSKNADANIIDVAGEFYSTAFNTAAENFVPGWGFILSNILGGITDIIAPGLGAVVESTANALTP